MYFSQPIISIFYFTDSPFMQHVVSGYSIILMTYIYIYTCTHTPGLPPGFFLVVQHHLDSLVHHLDHNETQLCTPMAQSKAMNGYGAVCYSAYVSKGLHRRYLVGLCIVVVFVGWMDSLNVFN